MGRLGPNKKYNKKRTNIIKTKNKDNQENIYPTWLCSFIFIM